MRLKSEWDPSFSKEDFIYGAENAAVNISWLLQDNDWKELRGLLTRKEFKRLQTELETEWSDVKRQNVGFQLDHIKSTFITAIRTQTIVQKRLSVLLLE